MANLKTETVAVEIPVARLFQLVRSTDVSGVSGTGIVALGTLYPNGKCTISWTGEISCIGVYDSLEQLIGIHGHGGNTVVRFT